MPRRSMVALLVIAAAIAGLGILRSLDRTTDPAPPDRRSAATDVAADARPTLLDFGRGTCVPCQKMMPVLDELAQRHTGAVDVRYMDLADPAGQARARELRVRIIPTQVLIAADGSEVGRHEGFWPLDEVEARFEELGWTTAR